ncbi:MAG: topoisomerase DNA-binding C4 zinc finger domain-containing protein [Anaerolineae bacterium]|nr:topoisomerase DNA-binding C4 zinc finger domain-containing protein [Anaerolineae bacterium]
MKLQENAEVEVYCPHCVPPVRLVVKTNTRNGSQFLGCPNWPDCTYTRPLTEDLVMIAQGAVRLPGF